MSPEVAGGIWKQVIAIADKYYQPGKFTTFAAYEWTSTPDNRNMHRNIIFKDSKKVPEVPFSAIDSDHPEDLWNWMNTQRQAGNELLAISHNANLSDGIMFPLEVDSKGRPIDAAWAQERVNNEPLTEIHQLKGTSETHPMLSPNDEFADYELLSTLLGGVERTPKIHGSYIREAWQNGVAMQDSRGYDPYKMGVVGASDSHSTAAGYSQSDYFGGHALFDATPEARLSGKKEVGLNGESDQHCRPRGRVGGREHARIHLRGHAAQGNLRHQWRAHQGPALRRLGFPSGRTQPKRLGEDRVRQTACRWAATFPRKRARNQPSSCGR